MRRAPEVHLEHCARGLVGHAFELARDGVSRVVEHDVDTAERLLGLRESGLDLVRLGDVQAEDEELLGGVLGREVVEDLGLAESGDDAFAVGECDARHLKAEA